MVNICEITIGKFIFRHVNHVKIESSRKKLGDTAIITLPRRYESKSLAKEIKEGDAVEVKLGYDESDILTEFTGFVSVIGCNIPVEIHCEDQVYNLKRTVPKPKSWSSTTLKDVIKYLAPGITTEVPDITLSPFYIKGVINVSTALEEIRDAYGLDIYFRNGKLFAGLAYSEKEMVKADPIIYYLRWKDRTNVIHSDLEFKKADAVRIKLKAISMMPDNKVIKYEYGDHDGEIRTMHYYNKTSDQLKVLAKNEINNFKYDGYRGHFTALGIPVCHQGNVADIREEGFEEKNGKFFADKVIVDYGMGGFRREIELGRKVA